MYCKHCGKEISDGSRLCRFCGKPLIVGAGETISAGGDAYKGIGIEGTAAMGGGIVIQINELHVQGMCEDRFREIVSSQLSPILSQIDINREIVSSQLSPILSQIGIKDEIGREPTELTQEQRMLGEAINEKVSEADQWFDKSLGTPDTYLKLGNFEHDGGNYEKAIEYYDKIIKMDIRNVGAWNNKGITLDTLKRYDDAIKCFDKALELNPEDADAWNNKGAALSNLGRSDDAMRCYDKALEIKPAYAGTWNNKGLALRDLERYDDAIKCFDKALEINPEHKLIKKNREITKMKRGSKII